MELKLKIPTETVTVSPSEEVVKIVIGPDPVVRKPDVNTGFKQRVPAYWTINPGKKEGDIIAYSNLGDRFEGSGKEFNRLMRA